MTIFQNKAISASAGSGKTFRLAHRYMGLLARGVPSDRICALTFSRKAAGEIFDTIVRYLTRAAQNPEQAELSSEYMEAGAVPPGKFLSILRCFVENLHSANIGTLDSFIVGIIRAFPLELGLNNADFNLMDNDSADAESFREDVVAAVCNSKQIRKTDTNIFLESFRQATLGIEKKTFADNLSGFLSDYRAAFLGLPAESSWGNPSLIWKQPPWWLKQPQGAKKKDLEEILQIIAANSEWHKRMRNSLTELIEHLMNFDAESEWEPSFFADGRIQSQIIKKLNFQGAPVLKIEYNNKEYLLPDKVSQALRELYHNLFHVQFSRLLKRTRGIFNVIAMYEKEYERSLLQTGNMTFIDAQLILSPHGFASGGIIISHVAQPHVISRSPDPQACPISVREDRLFIDYRLDSKIDHWLMDEFQDTSNLQWQVVENLVDEILQDDSNTRSFFYVGDVKQTIYRWRGGNPDLFNSVLERYGRKIANEPLNETQRSAQPIIDMVNKVFSRLPETRGENSEPAIPGPVINKWSAVWQEHKCGKQVPADGYAALIQAVLPESGEYHENGAFAELSDLSGDLAGVALAKTEAIQTNEGEEHLELLARLLKYISPMERELSTAILVRKNKTGKKIADFLRRYCPELNISYEGETALLDSPVVRVILDLLRFAEHPADNFARQHLMMSPMGAWLNKNTISPESIPLIILRKIQADGFKPAIRAWATRLGKLDVFGSLRLNQMLEIAGQFDGRFERNIALFIKTVESFGVREASEAEGCVHIMTIHQSKGLGFDLVILPDLNAGEKMNSAGAIDFLAGRSKGGNFPAWLLTVPDRKTAGCDPILKQSLDEADNLETLDNLCLLYVAMTRAKKALYILNRIQEKKYFNMAAFLERQLSENESQKQNVKIGGAPLSPRRSPGRHGAAQRRVNADILYETGDRNWFEKEGLVKPAFQKTPAQDKKMISRQARRKPLEKIEPSLEENITLKASWLFKAESPEVLHFGSAIHELFREVEWSDNCRPDEIIRNWKPGYPYPAIVIRDVKEQFMRAMAEPKILSALSKPAGNAELWREKSFDVILNNKWISGIFDRVVILRAADGTPVSAKIMDYKSNRASDPEVISRISQVYKPQITLYRQALSSLLNLRETSIEACLLFTVSREIIT